jgi:5-methylcytosine-specific restriction endonuclease McrBC regulatory subunit McrC
MLNADVYQLLAYTISSDLPGGLLIYAAGEHEPVTHYIRHVEKELKVVTLDLQGDPDDVLAQISKVAQHVKALRHQVIP